MTELIEASLTTEEFLGLYQQELELMVTLGQLTTAEAVMAYSLFADPSEVKP